MAVDQRGLLQVGLAFVRDTFAAMTAAMTSGHPVPNGEWDHFYWRRSALEFLPELLADPAGTDAASSQHAAVLQALAHKAGEYDEALLAVQSPVCPRPSGLDGWRPEAHWWWRLPDPRCYDSSDWCDDMMGDYASEST